MWKTKKFWCQPFIYFLQHGGHQGSSKQLNIFLYTLTVPRVQKIPSFTLLFKYHGRECLTWGNIYQYLWKSLCWSNFSQQSYHWRLLVAPYEGAHQDSLSTVCILLISWEYNPFGHHWTLSYIMFTTICLIYVFFLRPRGVY